MKYLAIIDDSMLSNFRRDDDGRTMVVTDKNGASRGIILHPVPKGHGRLKDEDEVIRAIEDRVEFLRKNDALL